MSLYPRTGHDGQEDPGNVYPDHAKSFLPMLSAARHLERIADHATKIAEDVIYMIEGVIVRHKAEDNLLQRFDA